MTPVPSSDTSISLPDCEVCHGSAPGREMPGDTAPIGADGCELAPLVPLLSAGGAKPPPDADAAQGSSCWSGACGGTADAGDDAPGAGRVTVGKSLTSLSDHWPNLGVFMPCGAVPDCSAPGPANAESTSGNCTAGNSPDPFVPLAAPTFKPDLAAASRSGGDVSNIATEPAPNDGP